MIEPDGHNDLAAAILYLYDNKINDSNFTNPFEHGTFPLHVDLPRLKTGRVGGSFWAAYTPCPRGQLHNRDVTESALGQSYSLKNIHIYHTLGLRFLIHCLTVV